MVGMRPGSVPQRPHHERTAADRSRAKRESESTGGQRPFRHDIQGLRAVAVLAVFADHLVGWPTGGFVGVDVFFVLSGFLITGLLLREFRNSGRISFSRFFARRARRLLPASILTLTVTLAVSFIVFAKPRGWSVFWDGVASLLFAANWRFATTGTDYFAQGAPSPLRHFWSLAVEEQFYFIWPALLLAVLLVHRRRTGVRGAERSLGVFAVVIMGLSFSHALIASTQMATFAYFSTFTRAWELAAGATLAIMAYRLQGLGATSRFVLHWTGLALIGLSIFLIGPETVFPAPGALVPVLGTVMVIAAGTNGAPPRDPFLTNPVSRYIGDISYSLYLWHWPVIVFTQSLMPYSDRKMIAIALVASFVLAVLSYELVERPLTSSPLLARFSDRLERRRAWDEWKRRVKPRFRSALRYVALPAVLAGGVATIAVTTGAVSLSSEPPASFVAADQSPANGEIAQGIRDAVAARVWPAEMVPSIENAMSDGAPIEDSLDCANPDPSAATCQFGSPAAGTVIVYGDSLGTTLLPSVRAGYESDSLVRGYTQYGCAVIPVRVNYDSTASRERCEAFQEGLTPLVEALRPEIVFVTQNYGWGRNVSSGHTGEALSTEWGDAAKDLQDSLYAAGAERVVFVSPPPEVLGVQDCAVAGAGPEACLGSIPGEFHSLRAGESAAVDAYVDITDLFCFDERCPAFNGETLVRRDWVHPTRQYAAIIGPTLRDRVANAALAG